MLSETDVAARVICEGMKDLGVMKGDTDAALAAGAHAVVEELSITASDTGVSVLDSTNCTTHTAVEVQLDNTVQVNGGAQGLLVSGTNASVSAIDATRFAGQSKWNYWRLWNFALDGITSFTIAPLKISTYLGLLTAAGAFAYGIYMVVDTLIYGNPVPGYPSLIVIVLILGGVQLTIEYEEAEESSLVERRNRVTRGEAARKKGAGDEDAMRAAFAITD